MSDAAIEQAHKEQFGEEEVTDTLAKPEKEESIIDTTDEFIEMVRAETKAAHEVVKAKAEKQREIGEEILRRLQKANNEIIQTEIETFENNIKKEKERAIKEIEEQSKTFRNRAKEARDTANEAANIRKQDVKSIVDGLDIFG